jgi:protein KRI1
MEPPSKKPRKLLEDSESDSDEDIQGGVSVPADFKINAEYARRFEYNKKREERQQCMYRNSLRCIFVPF